jgi:predicted Zn-dependent peptidase
MLDRTLAPPAYPIDWIQFPKTNTYTTKQGVNIHSISLGEQPVFKFEYTIHAGASEATKAGVASLTSMLMKRGTQQHSAQELNQKFDFYGAFWDVQSSLDHATFTVYGLTKHFESLMPLVFEIITQATFPIDEFEKEIAIEIQKSKLNWQKTAFSASQLFRAQLFPNDPYGRVSNAESLQEITRDELVGFHQTNWLGQKPTIFLSGQISAEAIACVASFVDLSITPKTALFERPVLVSPRATRTHESREQALQCSIRMGQVSMNRQNPDYYKFSVLNTILGGFFGSRLQKNIREEKGFTYGISSSIVPLKRAGYWAVGTDVNKENAAETCSEIRREIQELRTNLIPSDELEIVKSYLMGSFTGELTQAFDIADKLKIIYLEELPIDFYDHFQHQIMACTSKDLRELANQYLDPSNLLEVIVGAI